MNFDNSTMPIFMCKTIANKNPQIIVLSIPKYFLCMPHIFYKDDQVLPQIP